jgi:hypothetical protein
MKVWPLLASLAVASGCSKAESPLPMAQGNTWTYNVRTSFHTYSESLTVLGDAPVGPIRGMELKGPMGAVKVGFDGKRLIASKLGFAHFDPPIPIYGPAGDQANWRGWLFVGGERRAAKATLTSEKESLRTPTRTFSAVKCRLSVVCEGDTIELDSWFAKGVGLVRQEQRTNGTQDVRLEWMSGPRTEK